MKKRLLFLTLLLLSFLNFAQDNSFNCKNDTNSALELLSGSDTIVQDVTSAITLLTEYADSYNCKKAQLELGRIYYENEYVNIDTEKAMYYLKLAANQGNVKASKLLVKLYHDGIIELNFEDTSDAILYENGLDNLACNKKASRAKEFVKGTDNITQNIELGIRLLTKYADQGCENAQIKLAKSYYSGDFVAVDGEKAFQYAKLASEQGNVNATKLIVKLYHKGLINLDFNDQDIRTLYVNSLDHFSCKKRASRAKEFIKGTDYVAQNIGIGMYLLTKYADGGCDQAQLKLARVFFKGEYIPNNNQKAFEYAKLANDQGNEKASDLLVKLCLKGIGCDFTSEQNKENYESHLANLPCKRKAKKAFEFVRGSSVIVSDVEKGLELLTTFADEGCEDAQYFLGLIYKKGYFDEIAPDPTKAFKYLNDAVTNGHIRATAHLGQLYERGFGCAIDYEKAFEYFEMNLELGDDMGAYCIGYDYMKGLGTVEQDYVKAREWFEKSEYPMATHWLAVLHYFGFGTPMDKDKGIELLLSNDMIKRSPRLLEHFEENKNNPDTILGEFKAVDINQETEEINEVLESNDIIIDETSDDTDNTISAKILTGTWEGKLIELDWSGEQILRYFPANVDFNEDVDTGEVTYVANINNVSNDGIGILLDDSLYFDNFNVSVPKLFKDDRNESINLEILSADIEIKKLDHLEYISAYVDSKVTDWNEPGRPMLMILVNKSITTDNGVEIDEDLINALFEEQGENFITLYPNPFVSDLLIQYEVEQEAYSTVEIYSMDGAFYQKIVDNELQTIGNKVFYFNGSELNSNSFYVVRVTLGDQIYTKVIIKE